MCNRQTWVIVVTTVIISLLMVATAILVYHYIIPQQGQNIGDLESFVNEFFDELPLSKEVEISNCRCQHTEVECDKQINIPQSLQSQLISFCPDTHIICCDVEDQPSIMKGSLPAAYEDIETDMNRDINKQTSFPSINENKTRLDENGLKFNSLNKTLGNLSKEVKEVNETLFSNSILEMPHDVENIDIALEVSTEEYLHIEEISFSNNSLHLGNIKATDIEQITNKSDKRNQFNNIKNVDNNRNKSLNVNNLRRKTFNDEIKFEHEKIDEILNSNLEEYDTLIENIEEENNDHGSGNVGIYNDHDEIEKIFTPEFNHTEEEYTLFDMMNELGMFNDTIGEFKEQIRNLSRFENFENIIDNQIEDDAINTYNNKQDSNLCSADDCAQNNQEENTILSNMLNANSIQDESESKMNSSYIDFLDLHDFDLDDIGFLLPLFEQDNTNSTSLTLYTPGTAKSKSIKDHIFYYSYLTAFLYVVGFLADFFIPIFSLAGLAVLQFLIVAFPKIIQSQIFDILTPFITFIYGIFGIL